MKTPKAQVQLLNWTRVAYRYMWDALLGDDVLLKASGITQQTAFRWVGEVDGIRFSLERGRFDSAALKALARMVEYNLRGFVSTKAQQQLRRDEEHAAWQAQQAEYVRQDAAEVARRLLAGGDDGQEA